MDEQQDPEVEATPSDAAATPIRAPRRRAPAKRKRRGRRGTFQIGKVFGTSLGVWGKNFFAFTMLGLIVFLPYAGFAYWSQTLDPESSEATLAGLLDVVLGSILSMLVTAPVIGAVFAQLRGHRSSLGAAISSGVGRIPAALGVVIVQGLIYAVCAAPVIAAVLLEVPALALILMVLGVIAFIVVSCGLYVAIPAAIVERPGVFGALSRSWTLTKGNKATIFVIFLLFGITVALAQGAVTGLLAVALGPSLSWIWIYLVQGLFSSMQAVFMAVIYHDLRVEVDGVDTEELAAVFD